MNVDLAVHNITVTGLLDDLILVSRERERLGMDCTNVDLAIGKLYVVCHVLETPDEEETDIPPGEVDDTIDWNFDDVPVAEPIKRELTPIKVAPPPEPAPTKRLVARRR